MAHYTKISDLLEDLDSHGAYDARELEKDIAEITGQKITLPKFSAGNMRTRVGKDFKGPEFVNEKTPDHLMLVSAWDVSTLVAETLLGRDPGAALNGRGSRHRACIAALKEAGL